MATVRYADPSAWIVATAAARALAAAPQAVTTAGDRIGVVVTSPRGPIETMAWVASAAREGYSSPLRYPATNPGSLAGVACIALTLRGPTLVLTMAPGQGGALAVVLGERWISEGRRCALARGGLLGDGIRQARGAMPARGRPLGSTSAGLSR